MMWKMRRVLAMSQPRPAVPECKEEVLYEPLLNGHGHVAEMSNGDLRRLA